MKILKLRFKNLNSLAGEWSIDFRDSEYQDNGIFAICGSTGAGKTTILDAICLALYGETPRLDKVTTKNNDIMTHGFGDCYSEVEFETRKGRYISQWSQKRSRGKSDGKLQSAKWEVANADDQRILSEKLKESQLLIEELTGMNFERFTRSIMLAQGEFSKFLKSGPDQRSPILEQITGTSIYSDISRKVYERYKEEKEKLYELNLLLDNVDFLSEEEKTKRQQESVKLKEKLDAQKQKLSQITLALSWQQKSKSNDDQVAKNKEESEALKLDFQSHEDDLRRLKHAEKALLYSVDWQELTRLRKEDQELKTSLENQKTFFSEQQKKQASAKEHFSTEQKNEQSLAKHSQVQVKIFKQVRELELNIQHLDQNLAQKTESYQKELQGLEKHQKQLKSLIEQEQNEHKSLAANQDYLTKFSCDQSLGENFSLLQSSFEALTRLSKQIHQQAETQDDKEVLRFPDHYPAFKEQTQQYSLDQLNQQAEAKRSLHQQNLQALELDTLINELQSKVQQAQQTVQSLTTEGQRERVLLQSLELNVKQQEKINKFKMHRHELVDGQSCPLCGSLEHPLFDDNDDQGKDLLKQFKEQESKVTQLLEQYNVVKAQLKVEEQNLSQHKQKRQALDLKETLSIKELEEQIELFSLCFKDRLQEQASAKLNELSKEKETLLANTLNLVKNYLPELNQLSPKVMKELQQRRQLYQQHLEQAQKTQQSLSAISGQSSALKPQVSTLENKLQQEQSSLKELREQEQKLRTQRQQIFADKNLEQEENKLHQNQESMKKTLQIAQDTLGKINEALSSTTAQITELNSRQVSNTQKLNNAERLFAQSLNNSPFTNETEFIAAQISQEKLNRLKQLNKQLHEKKHSIDKRATELEEEAKELKSTQPSKKSLEALNEQKEKLDQQNQEWNIALGAHQQALSDDQNKHNKEQERYQQKEAQEKLEARWRNLNTLIGSADGKKFRNYAQGITFEILISHANLQLQKMSDRYVLIRDLNKPLDLNVLDNYQAGEQRSCRNLSGGESFIISLALALGLSKMASEKISVDTLFLDEGFGTLDELCLETALETLASLQHEGKLIGLISHISSVKERISTQIHVHAQPNGHSKLEGPGIESIKN